MIIVSQVRRHRAPVVFMWQFFVSVSTSDRKKHGERRVDDVAVTSRHRKKQKKNKPETKVEGKNTTRVPTTVHRRVMEGSSRQKKKKELEKGFIFVFRSRVKILWRHLWVFFFFSKERIYCSPLGINWPWLPLRTPQLPGRARGTGL